MQVDQHSFSYRCGFFFSPSQTSHEMMMQCVSRVVSHPLHGESCFSAWQPSLDQGSPQTPVYSMRFSIINGFV